ncbi:hypothetical protein OPV22_014128 [Ensete ventricosum]|uniref:Yippee domain-containing protein n=1 Tax=Ensete ventricosum TaxID=4639 RepID=A0AAV8R7B2_ENSVE|nr:hypothetical protein OPV22_014128 [Ensete ventricosum]
MTREEEEGGWSNRKGGSFLMGPEERYLLSVSEGNRAAEVEEEEETYKVGIYLDVLRRVISCDACAHLRGFGFGISVFICDVEN